MFDNLGVGEFFMLAVFALLFFGPERLPQMGAKLGQWLGKLTQQSKLFMNQWREEALAIHDAVEEVRGIRDEIVAAQRQLAETMDSARGDITESLDEVKGTLGGSKTSLASLAVAAKAEERARQIEAEEKKAHGEQEAIEKTQAILANVQAQLADARPTAGVESLQEPPPIVQPPSSEAKEELDPLAQLEQAQAAWRETLASPARSKETPRPYEAQEPTVEPPTRSIPVLNTSGSRAVQDPGASKPKGPSATERTAQVMERMRRQLAGEAVEDLEALVASSLPTPSESPEQSVSSTPAKLPDAGKAEDEWTRNYNLIQEALKGKPKEPQSPPSGTLAAQPPASEMTAEKTPSPVPTDNGTQARIVELNGQVASLQNEIQSLKKALESLRAEMLLKTALSVQPSARIDG